jgi:hypothetical protein
MENVLQCGGLGYEPKILKDRYHRAAGFNPAPFRLNAGTTAPKQRRLPTPGRTEERHMLAAVYLELDISQ